MLTRPGPWCGVGTSPAMLTRCRLGAHLLGSALAPLLGPARPSPSGAGWGALRCSLAVASRVGPLVQRLSAHVDLPHGAGEQLCERGQPAVHVLLHVGRHLPGLGAGLLGDP